MAQKNTGGSLKTFVIRTVTVLLILCAMAVILCAEACAEEAFLYPAEKNGKYGFINCQGEMVIEPEWDRVSYFLYDYALAGRGDDLYVINRNGSVVTGPYKNTAWEWNLLVNIRSFVLGSKIFDCITGKLLECPPDFEGVLDDEYADTSTNLLLCVGKDRYGYLDRTTGEWAIEPEYDNMDQDWLYGSQFYELADETSKAQFRNGYALVGKGWEFRIINDKNEPIELPEGYWPSSSVTDGYFTVGIGETYEDIRRGIADVSGRVLFLTDRYSEIRLQEGGAAVAFLKEEDDDGMEDEADDGPEYSSNCSDRVTVIDMNGNELMKPVGFFSYYRNIPEVHKGYFSMEEDTTLGTALCSVHNGVLWYDKYSRNAWFDTDLNLVAAYRGEDPERGWYDLANTLFDLDHNRIGSYEELYPYWVARSPADNWGYHYSEDYSDVSIFWSNQVEKWGTYFSEDLQAAALMVYQDENEEIVRYGYIDKTGQFVIPAQYIAAGNFLNGLAMVITENGMQYIDHEGQVVWSEN